MNIIELFLEASTEELKMGFVQREDKYVCLLCGKTTEKGIIYTKSDTFYDAEKYMKIHIADDHGSVFDYLINLDKKITGLSDHQSSLLKLFYEGKSDEDVQKEMGIGSSSTIRNHRFLLKEKERQAKVFLVLMDLLKNKNASPKSYINPHRTAKMVDDRYNTTFDEAQKVIKKYFPYGADGPLTTFDMKEKNKLVVLREITKKFEPKRIYTEKEVNEILKTVHEDFSTIRRYLIEYGFMDRKNDGSQYWVKNSEEGMKKDYMDRKKELKQQYKEMKIEGGVYQIRNLVNNKVFITSTPNFKTMTGRIGMLNSGTHVNKSLQEDWNKYGAEKFVFEILEVLEEKEDGYFNKTEELKNLEKKWLDKVQPYGEKGYNKAK